jgi:phage terminase large subunit GpA-like protein
VPEGAALLFLGCDCQYDRVEWLLVGRGSNNRKFIVDYGVIRWPISEADGQRALNQLLRRQWTNYCGLPMSITMSAIDAGYETSSVLEFCKAAVRSLRCAACLAPTNLPSPKFEVRNTTNVVTCFVTRVMAISRSESIQSNPVYLPIWQRTTQPRPASSRSRADCEDRLYQELTAEHRVAVKRLGLLVFRWEKVSDRQSNEMLDCYVYSQAAMARHGCTWISAERWHELEVQCGGKPAPPRKSLAALIAEMPTYG